MKSKKVSCVIPFYNEGLRLFATLKAVTNIDAISQVICIDDGSTDDTAKIIKSIWPEIVVIRLNENKGKAAAVRHGLEYVAN